MPKVLRILNRLIVGGPVLNAAYLTHYMSPEFETLLVVGKNEIHEESAAYLTDALGITPVYLAEMVRSISLLNDYRAYKKLKKIIEDFKPDIVHTHAAKPGAIGRMAASAMKVPVILHTYHGHIFHSYFNKFKTTIYIWFERYLARKTDAIIAISPMQKKELVSKFKIARPEKFRVIPLGLDLDKFQIDCENKRKKFRAEFGLRDNDIAIGIIGRLVPVKNHELFLEAIAYLLKNSSKTIKAFIVGDGELRNALEQKATSLNISFTTSKHASHNCPLVFTSSRNDIDVINAGLDIVTLTSFNEGTPVSLIEAQASQKPIVSTRVGGIEDVVKDGQTALLSDPKDHAGFIKNLSKLVENDELRKYLSSRDSVMEKYSYQRLIKDMSALYYELLSKIQKN